MLNNYFEISEKLSAAFKFAAVKHREQIRKDAAQNPYIVHPVNVTFILWGVGLVTDIDTLIAALLHDTIEDTGTKENEIADRFGITVLNIVKEVTDDKEKPKHERKILQIEHAPTLSNEAKLVKLADKISNIDDVINNPPPDWSNERRHEYLDWAEQVVNGLRGINKPLENRFDELLKLGKAIIPIT